MKKFIICLFFLGLVINSISQNWSAIGSGIAVNGFISSMVVYNGELYVGGFFDTAGGIPVNNIASWNGVSWDSVGSGINGEIQTMAVYQGKLYVAGDDFTYSGNIHLPGPIAVYNGLNWDSVPNSDSITGVNVLYTYDSLLFIGCHNPCIGNCPNDFAQFDGASFTFLGDGFMYWRGRGNYYSINSITSFQGEVWAGGKFLYTNSTSSNDIDYWDRTAWNYNGYGIQENGSYRNCKVYSLTSDNNYLYAGGYFSSANKLQVSNIAEWNGTSWDSLGSGINPNVLCLIVYNNDLVAGGDFDSAGGKPVNKISYWDGTKWNIMGRGIEGNDLSEVASLSIYNGELYVGGVFSSAGGIPVNNIAKYGTPLGVKGINNSNNCSVFPNPNQGNFTIQMADSYQLLANSQIEIYNVLGEVVETQYIASLQSNQFNICLSSEPSGLYFYRIIKEDGNLLGSGKIVIEK